VVVGVMRETRPRDSVLGHYHSRSRSIIDERMSPAHQVHSSSSLQIKHVIFAGCPALFDDRFPEEIGYLDTCF